MSGKSKTDDMDSASKPAVVNGSFDALLTPELLFKMNKKIANLTKVVYGLNTRGEELEGQLQVSKDSEDSAKALNQDLQQRVNTFKMRIENEMGRLRDLETQAQQSTFWKMECENLKRRLEAEGGPDKVGLGSLSHSREELEQIRRREAALQYELDQARHAINNLKAHHDFIMRERDAQQAMETEKIVLEWQSRMSDLESRYKSQNRRLTDDMEVLRTECEMLRGRMMRTTSSAGEEASLRDQLRVMQIQRDTERRDWEMKMKRKTDEVEEERRKLTDEKLEFIRKTRTRTEENSGKEDLEIQLRATKEAYEERIRELIGNQELLQRLVDDKEEECEVKLKTKVVEWKSEWDLAEEGLREEIRKLKTENQKLQTEVSTLRLSLDSAGVDFVRKIAKLEDDLADKTSELELKTKNFKVRLMMVENENKQYLQERSELEKRIEEERERYKVKLKNHETISERGKSDLQNRLQQAKEAEKDLKESNKALEEENDALKAEKEELLRTMREKDQTWQERLEYDVKTSENRVRMKVERVWIEKLKRTEESAAHDLDKAEEALKRRESSLKREIEVAKTSEEEIRTSNEDLKQKLRELGRRESEQAKAMKRLEEELQRARSQTAEQIEDMKREELANQESKYQSQIDDLTLKLAEKQQEVTDLVEKLSSLGSSNQTSSRETELEIEIEDMKKQVKLKENMAESINVDLQYTKNQNTIAQMKLERLEEELSKAKVSLDSLQEQNSSNARECARLKEVEAKMKSLEEELRKSEVVRKDLQESLTEIEAEREDELKIVQDALDEAAQEREELIMTFEKELKHLNTTNSAREQQMLEDFEWKLREMEKDHKSKLEEKERQLEAGLNAVRSVVESEMANSLTKMAEDRRIANEKLAEVGHLRSYEAEAIQLRGVTHEFQKALRASAREMENSKIRERILEEEIRSLKSGAQSRQSTLQRVKCHADEEELRQKVEKMKSELNAKWEDKLRSECSRLKSELDELHSEEKHLAVESMKVQKEQEMQALKKSWERTQEEMTKEISTLKDSLSRKDAYHHKEMDSQRTIADRDIWDLRMKLQKLNESSYDKQQQMEEKHKEDMERFRIDYEERIHEIERRLAARDAEAGVDHLGELEKEHKRQMDHLEEQHRLSMERLREELESDKFQAVEEARVILSKNHEYVESNFKDQINEYVATIAQCREELESLRASLARKDESLRSLRDQIERGHEYRSTSDPLPPYSPGGNPGLSSSQFSLASSSDSQGSRSSQDKFYLPENTGVVEGHEDTMNGQRASTPGLLGKVFGVGWFGPQKGKEVGRRGSTPLSSKKAYGS